jgi:hypothetical protein
MNKEMCSSKMPFNINFIIQNAKSLSFFPPGIIFILKRKRKKRESEEYWKHKERWIQKQKDRWDRLNRSLDKIVTSKKADLYL